jgi:hypothetical protein
MARGRMISKSLSTSERFAALHDHAGKMAEFCQSLYPLLVAHADDWGCQQGDVFTIKHLVHPTSPRKLPEFETALKHLHNAGLIAWYQADDKWVVCIRGFAAHQTLKGHDKDGRKRPFPPPPENINDFNVSAQSRPKSPKPALRELNLTELKRTEPIRGDGADAPPAEWPSDEDLDTDVPKQQVGAFIRRFCELYTKHRHGAKFMVLAKKHVPLIRNLLTVYDFKRLEKMAVVLLTTDEPWVKETDRGIGILSVKASWLDNLLSEYEAAHGEIQVAS